MRSTGKLQRILVPLMIALSCVAVVAVDLLSVGCWIKGWERSFSSHGELTWWQWFVLIAGAMSGVMLIWLSLTALLGYASPQANLRHRLVAVQLRPALVMAAIVFGTLGLVSQLLEAVFVKRMMKTVLTP